MAKRVLIYSLTYMPYIGGAEVAIKEITDRIASEDLAFDMITLRFDRKLPKYEKIGNIAVHRVGFTMRDPTMSDLVRFPLKLNKYLLPFIGLWHGVRLNRKRRYRAVWSMMANFAGFAALFFKMRFPDVPFLLSLQEGDPLEHIRKRVGPLYPLYRMIFARAEVVQTISNYLSTFAQQMGAQQEPIVVPNAVDLSFFSKKISSDERAKLIQRLRLTENDLVIITTSRLVRKNAVNDTIESLMHLPDRARLLIVGTGPDERHLRRHAGELGISNRITFLGQVDHREVPKYLQIADYFVRPSISEGMGNSFIEAMAAGVPVIATPVGGILDFLFDPEVTIDHKPTGLFCRVHDAQSIAEQIKRLEADHALRGTLIKNAQELVAAQYTWDLVAERMREVFAKLCK